MKIQQLADLFNDNTRPIVVFCAQSDIDSFLNEAAENIVNGDSYGVFENEGAPIKSSTIMISGKEIHFIGEQDQDKVITDMANVLKESEDQSQ